jgi:AmiR/NasT family two-component response regulator
MGFRLRKFLLEADGARRLADSVLAARARGAAAEAGALAYVVKPFTPNDLIPAIEVALSRATQIEALEDEISDMAERLETRKVLDRAKGILNNTMGLPEPEAFRWIQKASMDRRLTMKEVAQTVIDQLAEKSDNPDV